MKKALAGIGVTLLVTVLLFGQHITGYTTVFSEWVLNSLIDNTPIGSHTPSSGAFTTSSASGGFAGNLTGNASTATTLAADPSFTCTPGSYAAGIVANGNATNCQNSITGNSATSTLAATATQLASVTPCGTGKYGGGITVAGASTGCGPLWLMGSTSTVTATGSAANSVGSATITWPSPQFSGGVYMAVCSGTNPSGAPQAISIISQTGSAIGVQFVNGTASQAVVSSYGTITCWGQQ